MPSLSSILNPQKVPQVPQESNETQTDAETSPKSSKSTAHKTGIPIAAVDISPDRTHAVLAGHNILKTIQVSAATCAEDVNLRASVIAFSAAHKVTGTASASTHKDQWAANDVKWSHGECSTIIATAVANGQIIVYDLNKAGLEVARLHEHSRQVHRLAFNPHRGQLMLSGSQDGTVRLWDLRDLSGDRNVMDCHSRCKFSGNSNGVRDLRWSPVNGVEFALGTDNGVIQRWDIRNQKVPLLRINAHEHKTCFSIDWHQDGKHLASGGADKTIKVWDFSSSDRRKKHLWEIRTPQSVCNVRWRPAYRSIGKQNRTGWQCNQIASSYDQEDPRIHIWDLHRPYIPSQVIDRYDTPAAALLWHSESLLWSVGSAGIFTQTDINFIPKTMDHRNPNHFTIAADGKILFFSQKRERIQPSTQPSKEGTTRDMNQQSGSPADDAREEAHRSSGTRQDGAEDSNTLNSAFRSFPLSRHQASSTSPQSSTNMPPPARPSGPVEDLSESLQPRYIYHSKQVAGVGYFPGTFNARVFKFLARYYKVPPIPDDITKDAKCNLHVILSETIRRNAIVAARTQDVRLAQSLRVLAFAVEKELERRAERNYRARMQAAERMPEGSPEGSSTYAKAENVGTLHVPDQLQAQGKGSSVIENTSNMTTPLARAVNDTTNATLVPSNIEQLPDATWSKQPVKPLEGVSGLAKMASPKASSKEVSAIGSSPTGVLPATDDKTQEVHELLQSTGLADMDQRIAERRAAIDNYKPMPRPLLRLDEPIDMRTSGLSVPKFDRQDSDGSFQMFSASTDSSHQLQSAMGSLESTKDSQHDTSASKNTDKAKTFEHNPIHALQESLHAFNDDENPHPFDSIAHLPSIMRNIGQDVGNETSIRTQLPSSEFRPGHIGEHTVNYEDMEESFAKAGSAAEPAGNRNAEDSTKYIFGDFWPSVEDLDDLLPWHASKILGPLIRFHLQKLKDRQLPTWLLLHLGKWFHHDIPFLYGRGNILDYHKHLMDLECFLEAAELRKQATYDLPELAEYGLFGIKSGGAWCTNCQKANKGDKPGFCERCNERWAECPVCNGHGPMIPPDPITRECRRDQDPGAGALWTWCQQCGHGGHMACLSIIWDDKECEGGCPTVGCLCDCVPGARRDRKIAKLKKEWENERPGVVSRDEWSVPESAAAQRARGLVGPGRGILSFAAAGRIGSGGKKVRIVVPGEEDEDAEIEAKGKEKAGEEKAGQEKAGEERAGEEKAVEEKAGEEKAGEDEQPNEP